MQVYYSICLFSQIPHFSTSSSINSIIIRDIRNPGVSQCLGFCTADFWCSLAYESVEQKPKTLPNSRIPDTSDYYVISSLDSEGPRPIRVPLLILLHRVIVPVPDGDVVRHAVADHTLLSVVVIVHVAVQVLLRFFYSF